MRHLRDDYAQIQDPSGKIRDDEPVFLLRASDPCAPYAVNLWADQAAGVGANPVMVEAVRQWADDMKAWRIANVVRDKAPDVPEGMIRPLHPKETRTPEQIVAEDYPMILPSQAILAEIAHAAIDICNSGASCPFCGGLGLKGAPHDFRCVIERYDNALIAEKNR
jgi:hypothetical protein